MNVYVANERLLDVISENETIADKSIRLMLETTLKVDTQSKSKKR